ncbi:MAG: hypothetical protein CBC15_02095 [Candidatus Endolissoclinum sp. TMED55]|nr:MAG: hypothetical protein CBC15_02095 [Candidatus Endolissoclinum sp. TMED55]
MATDANKQKHIKCSQRSLEKTTRSKALQKLVKWVTLRPLHGKKNLVYMLAQVDRISQVAGECSHIKTLS